MGLENVLHMNAGDGESSYAKNSNLQKAVVLRSQKALEDSINYYAMNGFPECFKIADLGCSSGPNTLLAVTTITQIVHAICKQKHLCVPEFQVFLNDLPGNDFNATFKMLQPPLQQITNDHIGTAADEKKLLGDNCFVSGVPGSFYTRLFPRRSLHFVHSSSSVHWLSQVPHNLEKKNKGNIYMAEASPDGIYEAYFNQYKRDFTTFLHLRSEEITPGGCMVLTFQGRSSTADYSNTACCRLYEILSNSLGAMSKEGFVREADIDSFNIPFYNPSIDEVKAIIESEGSFVLDNLQTYEHDIEVQSDIAKQESFGKIMAKAVRVINEAMLADHFGDTYMDMLFDKYAEDVAQHLSKRKLLFVDLAVSLTRKSCD